jgi:hypothetical protein
MMIMVVSFKSVLVEMKQYNDDNKCTARMIMTKREALLLAEAINTLYNND